MLDAAGCDVVLVETVGVGQSEVEIAGLADTSIVLLAPGMGDGIQAAKAGILEIGDVFVVNKADRDGADATVRDLRHMISLGDRTRAGALAASVVKTVPRRRSASTRSWRRSTSTGPTWRPTASSPRRERRAADEIESIALASLRDALRGCPGTSRPQRPGRPGRRGRTDPYTAADALLTQVDI